MRNLDSPECFEELPFTIFLNTLRERYPELESFYENEIARLAQLQDQLLLPAVEAFQNHPMHTAFAMRPVSGLNYKDYRDATPRVPVNPRSFRHGLACYYDSDPFDYRDTTFLHEDGTPADYGDVFKRLFSFEHPISTTTAGWPLEDQVAQRAAEKLVQYALEHVDELTKTPVTISVHAFERLLYTDPDQYRRHMANVLYTLEPLKKRVEVRFLYNPREKLDREHIEKVVIPLQDICHMLGFEVSGFWNKRTESGLSEISFYSGRAKNLGGTPTKYESNNDVMSCDSGYFIRPKGSVGYVSRLAHNEPGSRPEPTGLKLYELPKKEKKVS